MREKSTRAVAHGWLTSLRRAETFRALHNRNFTLLFIGQTGHSSAMWVETVARSWPDMAVDRLGYPPGCCQPSESYTDALPGTFRRGPR